VQRLASTPCTIGGTIGGHATVAITWAHMLPLDTRPIPRDAVRLSGSSRFNHYYFGTDITIELVHGPSTQGAEVPVRCGPQRQVAWAMKLVPHTTAPSARR
jgi:hypothetical protein